MSDDYLTVIPTDPHWQPSRDAGERAAAVMSGMIPGEARRGLEGQWHDTVEVVFCGFRFGGILCPHCGAELTANWWADAVSARYEEDFRTLVATVPCCGVGTSLNDLVYDWPTGFARFRIEALDPERSWLTDEELAAVAGALGHPLRQILVHV
ncbi:hypothetical protein [Streptomyces sp. NPDC059575]|uniref:hypothetical protein n=1 Tax=Streptomyces sp. NPDC059575 TaxID=3346872 RepID=UPI0036AD6E3D